MWFAVTKGKGFYDKDGNEVSLVCSNTVERPAIKLTWIQAENELEAMEMFQLRRRRACEAINPFTCEYCEHYNGVENWEEMTGLCKKKMQHKSCTDYCRHWIIGKFMNFNS